jgi:hypothetical protein
MPSKRSKSQEREKKRKARQRMTDEQKEISREIAKKGMANLREIKTEEEKQKDKKTSRVEMAKFRENMSKDVQEAFYENDRMRKVIFRQQTESLDEKKTRLTEDKKRKEYIRDRRSEEEKEDHTEYNRQKKKISRENQLNEIKEFDKIEIKHKNRMSRQNLSKEKKSELKAKAKHGMHLLRKEGRLRTYVERSKPNMNKFSDLKDYAKKSRDNLEFLELRKPDIVQQINEEARITKEKDKIKLRELQRHERYMKLDDKKFKERTEEEEKELQGMKQESYASRMKSLKEQDMKRIKELKYESISSELEYWYEYHKLVTTEKTQEFVELRRKINTEFEKLHPELGEACPGLTAHLKWMKKEKQRELVSSKGDLEEDQYTDECVEEADREVSTLCEYEKLREGNIKKRKQKKLVVKVC